MKTIFNFIGDDWTRIKNHCRTTVGKEATDKGTTEDFKKKLLLSEHSPIRLLEVDWSWKGIKYWVSTEWSRHKFEKFIKSQRNDRQKQYDRNGARQDTAVDFDGYANAQNLIDAWRKRLCFQATQEARELAEDFKKELSKHQPELAGVLVPNCIYRGGCPEFHPCGFFEVITQEFLEWCLANNRPANFQDLQTRYDFYNSVFQESRK